MRPEMENGPRPVSARLLPRAWARGPAADDRAAESARRGAPRAPSWASSGPRCSRPSICTRRDRTAGHAYRASKTSAGDECQTLAPFLFSSPFCLARSGGTGFGRLEGGGGVAAAASPVRDARPASAPPSRWPWVAPCCVLAAGIPCRGNRAATPPLDSVGRGERRHGHRVHRRDRDLAHATVAGVRTGGGTR